MMVFARHETLNKSHKWSSNVWDGDCRDGDKILCNRCPLNHKVRERGRCEIISKNAFDPNTAVGRPTSTSKTDTSDT